MVKVVHLQYAPYSAGRAAVRLHNALLEENVDSSILSLHDDINDTEAMKHLNLRAKITAWLENKLQSYLNRNNYVQFGHYSFPVMGTNVSRLNQVKDADIIYLHWVQGGFLNLTNIEQLAHLGKSIIVIMHDMWPITGGCHHSFTCEKYKIHCDTCQIFPKNAMIDWPAREFSKKLKFYSKYSNLYFVSPSKWLFNCAKQSFLTKNKPVHYIPNIINSSVFKTVEKKIARNLLNIDAEKYVLAFGAALIDSPYKGGSYLQKALEIFGENLEKEKVLILIFGSGYRKKIADAIPFKTTFLGFLRDEYSTALVYNASDVFLIPSLADNQPTTVTESMSCGTPVVGFDVGGIPDMIKHKENGYLARYKDAEDFAIGIKFCLENNIKGRILPSFEKRNVIRKHMDLINCIIKDE